LVMIAILAGCFYYSASHEDPELRPVQSRVTSVLFRLTCEGLGNS